MTSHSYKSHLSHANFHLPSNQRPAAKFQMSLAVVLLTALLAVPSSAEPGCNLVTSSISLSPCLGYMAGGSYTPPASCCAQVDAIAKLQAHCLCWYLGSTAGQLGTLVNQALATSLPGACNIDNPFANQCSVASRSPNSSDTTTGEVPVSPSSNTTEPSIPAGGGKTTGETSAAGASVKHKGMPWVLFLHLFLSTVAALSIVLIGHFWTT
ncbi:hypothetical protein HPP92_018619 [Vanilla planifolia]|uniref:Bifunctional inhibitor/plant lipid transfer protein/seed storage helical domain-containing protein n=1 Tax=Vanilla planifolia TaxID=51239 RepID=A0A835QCD5_VANPL|nr:hypothetical protein HPP92_018619 [Vanilla planifolia]